MIALLIAYESVTRLFAPVAIHFAEAIPIACLGLAVNIASAWLLSGGEQTADDLCDHHGPAEPDHQPSAPLVFLVAFAEESVLVSG